MSAAPQTLEDKDHLEGKAMPAQQPGDLEEGAVPADDLQQAPMHSEAIRGSRPHLVVSSKNEGKSRRERMMATARLDRLSLRTSFALLALVEAIVLFMGPSLGAYLADIPGLYPFSSATWTQGLVFSAVVMLSMTAMGLYHSRQRIELSELLARIFISFGLAAIGLAVMFYFVPLLDSDVTAISLALGLSLGLVCLIRFAFSHLCQTDLLKRRILVLGCGEKANFIETRMRREADRLGFQVLGYVAMTGDKGAVEGHKCLQLSAAEIEQYVLDHQVEEIVVAPDQRRGTLPMESLYRCRINGVKVTDITSFVEEECKKIPLKMLHPSWMVYGTGHRSNNLLLRIAKRAFDLFASLLLLLIIWPVMLLTAMLIKLENGPRATILYSQQRVGRGGEPFWIYKFRSMSENAEKNGAVWAQANDKRVTVVGAFIRKYRIDELPQLFNIIRGDMSFVGPRPERPEFVSTLSRNIPYYGDRHQVKPGLSGWAQICYSYGASEGDALEKLQYDLYYIKHASVLMDTMILIQTLEVVLFGKGAR